MSSDKAESHSVNFHPSDVKEESDVLIIDDKSSSDEASSLVQDKHDDVTRSRRGAVYRNLIPDNYLARHSLYNSVMRWRPIRGTKFTFGQFLFANIILGLTVGLLMYEKSKMKVSPKLQNRDLFITGHITGYVLEYLFPLLILPLNRNPNGLFPYLFGSSWEYLLLLHKRVGDLIIILATIHAGTEVFFFNRLYKKDWKMTWDKFLSNWINLSGVILLGIFFILRIGAFSPLRKRIKYEIFHVFHVICTIAILYFLFAHVRHRDLTLKIIIVPLVLWGIDIIWRIITSFVTGRARIVSKQTLHESHATILDLELSNNHTFFFEPGQWAYLCVPSVSLVEFHPFAVLATDIAPDGFQDPPITIPEDLRPESVSNCDPNVNRVRVLVKSLGDWTRKLESTPFSRLRNSHAFIQGPIGRIPTVFESFPSVILAGAGCGIAPIIGHAQRLVLYSRRAPACPALANTSNISHIWLVLVVPGRDMLVPFMRDLAVFDSDSRFHIILYETGPNSGLYDPKEHVVSAEEKAMVAFDVRIGLPDMNAVFDEIREQSFGLKTSVVTAGPSPFEKSVIAASRKHKFTLHCEVDKW